MGDVFFHFNELNKHLQGKNKVLCDVYEIIKSFQRKLQLFENDLNSKELLHFPSLKTHIERNPDEDIDMDIFVKFLQDVQIEFSSRFSEFNQISDLLTALKNLFSMKPNGNWVTQAMHLFDSYIDKARLQLETIELQESSVLKESYQATQITKFWTDLPDETYPNLRKIGLFVLTMFGSTYVCEATFSKMNYVKNKFRSRLTDRHLEDCLIAATTSYNPEFTKIIKDSKSQFSH
ncbi:General transcription factor II-I repeat domain-containing protein 2A [Camponotus japonicus]